MLKECLRNKVKFNYLYLIWNKKKASLIHIYGYSEADAFFENFTYPTIKKEERK